MTTFISMDHLKVTHNYATGKWQDFTGSLSGVTINMREGTGMHTASMSFYNATMDPSQSDGTRVVKKGDLVNVWVGNAAGRRHQLAQFYITKAPKVDIDLRARAGRQNRVTISLLSSAAVRVSGAGSA